MTALVCGNVLLTVVLLATFFVTWRLTRQVRRLFREVAPAGALTGSKGPQPGDTCPSGPFRLLNGAAFSPADGREATLLLFVSATCPVSRKIIPIAQDFCRKERVDLIFAGDDASEVQQRFAQQSGVKADHFVNDSVIGRVLEVDKLPAAFLLSSEGVILSRGLVNSREHLESLLNAWESGFTTVQDYITHRKQQKIQTV
ncbi:methylamine utilization protein MauD [Acetobacter sp.]|uniref:methylamine utilization protein MauD n=1 Tax=Acetobacter sp. TaxID=440 RepID=UPI0025B82043|nr:methylamine utilization protein MauD [Acetobacter sp.]MCH4089873.1 methylamine utilization protein MauD [Acetobacter sp.]MCI1298569.1 methylamine utilization protein MauD [Acetobacter sp.]MCI1315134.1 methylamine utilization protein MauD [Acetobacter sp.]